MSLLCLTWSIHLCNVYICDTWQYDLWRVIYDIGFARDLWSVSEWISLTWCPHTCAKLIWHLSQTYTLQLVSIIPWPMIELNSQPAWLNLDWNWSCDLWCWRFKHFLEIYCVTCVFVFSDGMVYCWFFNTDISENIRICVFAIVCTSETYLCHMRTGADYLWQEAAWQTPSSPYTFLVKLNIP